MQNITELELQIMLNQAAEKGAERAIEKITTELYVTVGKKVITKVLQSLGVLFIGLAFWGIKEGWFK